MTTHYLQRFRQTAILMEAYADEHRPDQAAMIHEAVLTLGEMVESVRMVARYDYQTGTAVEILRKGATA